MEVLITNAQRLLALDRKALRRRLEVIRRELRYEDDLLLGVALIRDKAMRALNGQYRGEDGTTDVLAFPPADSFALTGERGEKKTFGGEVLISVDEVLRQAGAEAVDCGVLADRLLVHGLLHLRGYDHHAGAESARMQKEEERMAGLLDGAWLSRREAGNR